MLIILQRYFLAVHCSSSFLRDLLIFLFGIDGYDATLLGGTQFMRRHSLAMFLDAPAVKNPGLWSGFFFSRLTVLLYLYIINLCDGATIID
ncbi:hypothetical protein H9Y13_18790 [Aeromonas veronii]|uniref:hypothetical protein n=1 Tax=Aeromonas TaxID=642 RepID=UPI0022EA7753|nr:MULTISPECIES: hypothetical protein [Aeromonas]KAJ8740059.1 hypothetical protein H9Y13_18790 [Aeromonas veronii]MDA3317877.1 hypothetical protein [Aeromonas sp. PI_26]